MCAETKKMPDRECLEDMIRREEAHYTKLTRLQGEIVRWQQAYNDLVHGTPTGFTLSYTDTIEIRYAISKAIDPVELNMETHQALLQRLVE